MRVMWITMSAIGKSSHIFYGQKTQSGGWVDATHEKLIPYIKDGKMELHIVVLGDSERIIYDENSSVTYHMVKINRLRGKAGTRKDVLSWKKIIDSVAPDLIQIWGTEFSFGREVLQATNKIPVCFYIQGVMGILSKHPAGDVPLNKLFLELGPLSFFKFNSMVKEIRCNKKHVPFELDMIKKADAIFVDNMWTKAQYHTHTDKFYNVPLAVNEVFLRSEWNVENCEQYTIFTVAGGASPIKGIHNAVLAVASLKQKYPNIKLRIPGNISSAKPHVLYDTIFIRQIKRIIKKYNLEENVVFLGQLSSEDMARQLREANVFVMPSLGETHSSSLRESMYIGCPVVSAMVGSVAEFVSHGESGFLYRSDEVGTMAYFIDKIFSDRLLASKLSAAGRIAIRQKYPQDKIGEILFNTYSQIAKATKEN